MGELKPAPSCGGWTGRCHEEYRFRSFGRETAVSCAASDVTELHDLSIGDAASFTTLKGELGDQLATGKFSIDGRYFAAGGEAGTIIVWNTSSAKVVHTIHGHQSSIGCLCWDVENRLFSYDVGGTVTAWNVRDEEQIWSAKTAGPWPEISMSHSMAISPNGKRLFVGEPEGSILILDSSDGNVNHRIQVAGGSPIRALAVSHNGSVLAAGSYASNVQLFDASTRERLGTLPLREMPKAIAFSPDSTRCAVAEYSLRMSVFDMRSKRRIFRRPLGSSGLSSVAFSQSGRRLFVLSKDRMHVMDAEEGHDLYDWSTPISFAMDFCPSTRAVGTVAKSGEVRIYEPTLNQK